MKAPVRPGPEVEIFEQARVKDLDGVVQRVLMGSKAVVELLQNDRDLIRETGMECLAVEISGLLKSNKLERVAASIGEAVAKKTAVTLTVDGLGRVRRLESLLSEVDRNIGRFTMGGLGQKQPTMGEPPEVAKPVDVLVAAPLIALGVIAIGLVVYAATAKRK